MADEVLPSPEQLSTIENQSILAGLEEMSEHTISYESPGQLQRVLRAVWDPGYRLIREGRYYRYVPGTLA